MLPVASKGGGTEGTPTSSADCVVAASKIHNVQTDMQCLINAGYQCPACHDANNVIMYTILNIVCDFCAVTVALHGPRQLGYHVIFMVCML